MDSPKDWMREYPHHLEDSVILQATPESLFSFLDDHRNLGALVFLNKSDNRYHLTYPAQQLATHDHLRSTTILFCRYAWTLHGR